MALPHFHPRIEVFSTSDLNPILSRSGFSSAVDLLSAFETGVEQVKIRTSTFESKLLNSFGIKLIERVLPNEFSEIVEGGVDMGSGKRRISTVTSSGGFGGITSANIGTGGTSQLEKDELFLEDCSNGIKIEIDNWIQETKELDVRLRSNPSKSSPKLDGGEQEEGWKGKSVGQLSPWFSTFSNQVLSRREIVPSETFAWPVACEWHFMMV